MCVFFSFVLFFFFALSSRLISENIINKINNESESLIIHDVHVVKWKKKWNIFCDSCLLDCCCCQAVLLSFSFFFHFTFHDTRRGDTVYQRASYKRIWAHMSHSVLISTDRWNLWWPTPECSTGALGGQSGWALAHPGNWEVTQCSLWVGPSWVCILPIWEKKENSVVPKYLQGNFQFLFLNFFLSQSILCFPPSNFCPISCDSLNFIWFWLVAVVWPCCSVGDAVAAALPSGEGVLTSKFEKQV